MKMTGSKNPYIIKSFASFKEAYSYHLENEDTIAYEPSHTAKVNTVIKCKYCDIQYWGNHTSKYCPDCKTKAKRESYEIYKEKQKAIRAQERAAVKEVKLDRVKWDEMPASKIVDAAIADCDAVREKKAAVAEWNERHCCPLYGCKGSVMCYECMRGKNYAADPSSLSNRRCPDNPIAQNGERYIQRAAYRKNPDGTVWAGSCKRYDVLDNMPQHLKVELVERMRKMGREFYIWSNGHVDTTPDPDSNC